MSLLDIFNGYRSGDMDVFEQQGIFEKISRYKRTKKGKVCDGYYIEVNNSDLKGMISSHYNKFRYKSTFRGSFEDILSIYFAELMDLINDNEFKPKNQSELCSALKRRAERQIYKSLVDEKPTVSIEQPPDSYCEYSKDDDRVQYNPTDRVVYDEWLNSLHSSDKAEYIGIFRDLVRLGDVERIKEIFPTDAYFQKRMIDLLSNEIAFAEEDDDVLKPVKELMQYLNAKNDEQVTKALNNIYDRLMEFAVGCAEYSRTKFKKHNTSSVESVHKILSEKSERELRKGCKSNNTITNRYAKAYECLIMRVNELVEYLTEQGFEPDRDKILDYALFQYGDDYKGADDVVFWNFSQGKKSGYKVELYDYKEDGTYKLHRDKRIEFSALPECYVIGNCVVYADCDKRNLIYLQKENRLFAVVKRNNKYYGYKFL